MKNDKKNQNGAKAPLYSANVRDDLPGTAGTSGAASLRASTLSASGGGLGRSLR